MRRLRRFSITLASAAAVFAAAGLSPARAVAPPPDAGRIDALEARVREMQRLYEARIAALEKEVAELRSVHGAEGAQAEAAGAPPPTTAPEPPGTPPATPPSPEAVTAGAVAAPGEPTPSQPPAAVSEQPAVSAAPPPAAAPSQTSNYFNPSISAIGNFLAVGGSNHTENLPVASLRESELGLQAIVDPYARADFFLSFGEEGVDVEEGYITFLTLPWDLQAKVGRMRAGFGKTNPLHLHVLPWPDEPLPVVNLLGGEEGWIGTGGSISRIIPLPGETFSEATVQIFRGDAEGLFQAPDRGDLAYNARYRVFRDLSEAVNIDAGLSWALGPNGSTDRSGTKLEGVDMTLRWKPLQTATYRSASFRAEYIRSHREQPGDDAVSGGWFASGEYQLAKRWFVGARFEAADNPMDDTLTDKGAAALLTFWPSEFSQLRGEYRRRHYDLTDESADEFLFQIQFAIGAHGAHPF